MPKLLLPLLLAACVPTLAAGPLKVFILAGQSNMQGHGRVEQGANGVNGAIGSLRYEVTNDAANYGHLVDPSGNWKPREDVWIWSLTENSSLGNPVEEKGDLNVGYGVSDRIGPELGFGHVIGDLYEDQVLLIKTSWGGKSLAVDFRPPYAGGTIGPYYTEMLSTVRDVLANLATEFPDYDESQGYEVVGFGWHQGWNDRINQTYNDEYESNLANFVRAIRTGRFGFGEPNLPFVVAETGMNGCDETNSRALSLMEAQRRPSDPALYPEFAGTVAFRDTQSFWRDSSDSPNSQGYHWNGNGETYYLIGDSMGRAMACLLLDPEVRSVERDASGDVLLTPNLPVTEVAVQRSDSPDPATFSDVPFTISGNTLCVDAAHVDPGATGSAYFRLVERPSNPGACP